MEHVARDFRRGAELAVGRLEVEHRAGEGVDDADVGRGILHRLPDLVEAPAPGAREGVLRAERVEPLVPRRPERRRAGPEERDVAVLGLGQRDVDDLVAPRRREGLRLGGLREGGAGGERGGGGEADREGHGRVSVMARAGVREGGSAPAGGAGMASAVTRRAGSASASRRARTSPGPTSARASG